MNITELARKLRATPNELFEELPKMGFDIGKRAIKVDDRIAGRILKAWGAHKAKIIEKAKLEQDEKKIEEIRKHGPIKVPATITVRDFATKLGLPVNKILTELMKNGMVTSLNERLDFDMTAILADDLGIEIVLDEESGKENEQKSETIESILKQQSADTMINRPPVVVIMGHVDHGKTRLLDTIRDTHIIEGESGGITQHIGAYQAWATPKDNKKKKKTITFIDTPGHEAFTTMRSRGAKIADIAILVVAADDGVMPQTIEAYKIIEQAKIPVIVAINKIDKPAANIEKVKQELSSKLNLLPEDWGGKTICVPISAKENKNLDQLLEMILLVTDMEQDKIKANPNTKATGTTIEAHLDKGEGPVATVLVQNGTLNVGEFIIVNNTVYGKIKAMKDFHGDNTKSATPAMPVKILGLKIAPQVGDIIQSEVNAKIISKNLKKQKFHNSSVVSSGTIIMKNSEEGKEQKQVNLIIKTDVLGSLEVIIESIHKIEHPEVKINIISKGLGNINEADILRAEPCGGLVIGFHVLPTSQAKTLADSKKIEIKNYQIIYELLKDVTKRVEANISNEIIKHDLGKLKVLVIFRQDKDGQVVGGKVIGNKITKDGKINIRRDNKLIGTAKLISLRNGKEEVNEVADEQECGIHIKSLELVEIDDMLEFYREESKVVKL